MTNKERKLKLMLKFKKFKLNHLSIYGYTNPIIVNLCAKEDEIYLNKIDISKLSIVNSDISNIAIIHSNTSLTNFTNTNLSNANLLWNNMARSDFSNANLRNAMLYGSDLSYANFRGADLTGADLRNTNLSNANFEDAILDDVMTDIKTIGFHSICPEGKFIAWARFYKASLYYYCEYCAKLLIPKDAKRYNGTTNICRSSKAILLGLYDKNKNINVLLEDNKPGILKNFKINQVLHSKSFDDNRWSTLDDGIHFVISKEESNLLNYNLTDECNEGLIK